MKRKLFIFFIIIVSFFSIYFWKDSDVSSSLALKEKEIKYNGNNLRVSIDGNTSETLPTSGSYYLASYSCKSSNTTLKWDRTNYKLIVDNDGKSSGVSCYLDFQSNPKLNNMPAGSYVKYVGNNGCTGKSCEGQNANYVSDTDMGYCYDSGNHFIVNGWRIAYQKDGSAYLISAGSPECMCTSKDGIAGTSCSNYETTNGVPQHLANLNRHALAYCNQDYAYNGACDSTSTWNINDSDYQEINESRKSLSKCYGSFRKKYCGLSYSLVDNGGDYWFATSYSSSSAKAFMWFTGSRFVRINNSDNAYGLRPVLRLQSSVVVLSGEGTYTDPFVIGNNAFKINNGKKYVNKKEVSRVQLSLTGLSDVTQMCVNVDSAGCSNYVTFANSYTLDWSGEADGEKVVYVYYKNSAGEIVASMNRKIIVDTKAPSGNSFSIGDGEELTRVLTISSTGADYMCFSNTSSNVSNCTDWVDYATSYSWTLSDGNGTKTVYGFFKDEAGNVSSTSATVTVTSIGFSVNENFADTTYDSNLTVAGSGSYPWIVSNGQFQSNNKGVNNSTSTSTIQFTPTVDATLSFDYGVSSESNYDKLTITLSRSSGSSTTLVNAISGTNTGKKSSIKLSSGVTYTLTLSYSKDGSASSGSDIGYIDNLVIVPNTNSFSVSEDFSDTTYDSNLTVAGSGSYPWIVSNGQFQSNNKGVNNSTSTSTIQFTPTVDATLSFDYGVSSESNYDKLTITLSNNSSSSTTLVNAISGSSSGTKSDIALTAGVTYTLTLSYSKDSSQSRGSDIGYIDNLTIN